MKEKYAVILTGGYFPCQETVEKYSNSAEFIIAADSGFDMAVDYGVSVHFVVGDMDSVVNCELFQLFPDDKKLIVSHEKDETDTELALQKCWDLGYKSNIVIGGGGGRLDHIFGILWLFQRKIHPTKWVTDNETVTLIDGEITCTTEIGERISIFPLTECVRGMSSKGLKWELTGLQWERGDMGLSNETVDEKFTIKVSDGKLLMIRSNTRGVYHV